MRKIHRTGGVTNMGYAAKLGSSSSPSLEVINCGTYNSGGAGYFAPQNINLSNYTPKYANLKINENIFLGNIKKAWTSGSADLGRYTQNLTLSYSAPTLYINGIYSYTGSGTGDYLIYDIFIVI